jgi:hypothetical protein
MSMNLGVRRGAFEAELRPDRDLLAGVIFMPSCYAASTANLLRYQAFDTMGMLPGFELRAA